MNEKIEQTISNLEKLLVSRNVRMSAPKKMLYCDELTGTAAFEISAKLGSFASWNFFIVGNNEGYFAGGGYVPLYDHRRDEYLVKTGKTYEDENKVVIPITGFPNPLNEPEEWKEVVFAKKDFKPYEIGAK